ncbi:rhombosortase [Teredinibacter purpureus]|uniref:rhombosortase n=1 Tax=Teredinibacter purpureus TaxID=2731756 RepID=UPI0005F7AEFC|nr:rhombosortase [Teredinibacter purpureus]
MSYPSPAHTINPVVVFQLMPVLMVILALGIGGGIVNPLLEYQRDAILEGEIWRVLSGHLVHLGVTHTLLNLLGFVLIAYIFRALVLPIVWWLSVFTLAVGISILLLIYNPALHYYAGLSGVLHGLFVMLAIIALWAPREFNRLSLFTMLVFVFAKLVYEQTTYYSAGYIEAAMNAPVIVDSHLYGALLGFVIGFVNVAFKHGYKRALKMAG